MAYFDTHKAHTSLTGAGMTSEQADAIVNNFAPTSHINLATKDDLKDEIKGVRSEIKDVRTEVRAVHDSLKADIKGVNGNLKAEIKGVNDNLKADLAKCATMEEMASEFKLVRVEMANMMNAQTIRLGIGMIAVFGAFRALESFFA